MILQYGVGYKNRFSKPLMLTSAIVFVFIFSVIFAVNNTKNKTKNGLKMMLG